MSHRRHYRRSKWRSLYVWHRYVGLVVAVLACVLALTGIVLNRTEALDLADRRVAWTALLDWYGIEGPAHTASFATGERQLSQAGRRLYLDLEALPGEYGRLDGAAPLSGMVVALADGVLVLFSNRGELVERIPSAPPGLVRLGLDPAGAIVVADADTLYRPDPDFLDWPRFAGDPDTVAWSRAETPDPATARALAARYRGAALSWERVLLDLHSGRILGRHGPWVMDAAGALMIFLAGTGVWLWTRRRR